MLSTYTNDASKVNIHKHGNLSFQLKPIGYVFCDNIVLIAHSPIECVKVHKKLATGNVHMDNQRKEILGFLERTGYNIISACVKPLRITSMDGLNNHSYHLTLEDTLKMYRTSNLEYDKDKSQVVAQYFKIELAQLGYTEVLKLCNKSNVADLHQSYFVCGRYRFYKRSHRHAMQTASLSVFIKTGF